MITRLGARLRSAVCETEVIVVKAPEDEVAVTCGGRPMISGPARHAPEQPVPGELSGNDLGKRYRSPSGLEVLVVKAGRGTLAENGTPLIVVPAAALPSSD